MIFVMEDSNNYREETEDEFQEFLTQEGLVHFVCMALRPGIEPCMQLLEHTHYAPNTGRNELLGVRLMEWKELNWIILSIPIAERAYMDRCADMAGLRVADGVPTIFGGGEVATFPCGDALVYTLENVSGHPVYGNKVH